MKINDLPQNQNMIKNVLMTNSNQQPERNQRVDEEKAKTASPSDRVELSTRSKEMQKIYEVLQATPDIRTERVSELKKQIETGNYRVDSGALAEKIILDSLVSLIK